MNESLVVKALATVACVFMMSVTGCEAHRQTLKYDAIKSGVDPMVLSCAAGVSDKEMHICTIIAKRGESK